MTLLRKVALLVVLVAFVASNGFIQGFENITTKSEPEVSTSRTFVTTPSNPPDNARCEDGFTYYDKRTNQCHLLLNNEEATQFFETDVIGRLPLDALAKIEVMKEECANTYIRMYDGLFNMWAGPVPTWVDMYVRGHSDVLSVLYFQWKQRSKWNLHGLIRNCTVLSGTTFARDVEHLF